MKGDIDRQKTLKIIVSVEKERLEKFRLMIIKEGITKQIGRYQVRKDSPHVQGDEYHAHTKLPDGSEVAWTMTGKRRHAKKFPAVIPREAKNAIAKILRISPDILESYKAYDDIEGEEVFLIEFKKSRGEKIIEAIENVLNTR